MGIRNFRGISTVAILLLPSGHQGADQRMRTDDEQGAPRVLFVSHEASLTGAPKVLLTYLTWLSANTDMRFEILALDGGPLLADFSALAPTTVVEARGRGHAAYLEAGLVKAGYPRLGDRLKKRRVSRRLRDLTGFDAVYLNSATSALALRVLPEIPPLIISHVHELDSAFADWFDEFDRGRDDHSYRLVRCVR